LKVGVLTRHIRSSPSTQSWTPDCSNTVSRSKRLRGLPVLEKSSVPFLHVVRQSHVKCSVCTRSCRAFQLAKIRSGTAASWAACAGSSACAGRRKSVAAARTKNAIATRANRCRQPNGMAASRTARIGTAAALGIERIARNKREPQQKPTHGRRRAGRLAGYSSVAARCDLIHFL
jgi:hypothetical protein